MEQQPQKLTFAQKMEFATWLASFPALTAMILLRHGIGYRMLKPLNLFIACVAMLFFAGLAPRSAKPEHLMYFAMLIASGGIFQRIRRWQELRRDVRQHSYFIGASWLESLPLRAWVRQDARVTRFLDPLVCIFLGFGLAAYGSNALGLWLILSGFCLRLFEHAVHVRELDQKLDVADGLIEAGIQGDYAERFCEPSDSGQSSEPDAAIPTGLGSDLQQHLKRRKQTSAKSR